MVVLGFLAVFFVLKENTPPQSRRDQDRPLRGGPPTQAKLNQGLSVSAQRRWPQLATGSAR
jgi:hypothetical protein